LKRWDGSLALLGRLTGSSGCEACFGQSPPLNELQNIVGEADQTPFGGGLLDATRQELAEAARLLDLTEHRFGQLLP
jgi:hypothetical protein